MPSFQTYSLFVVTFLAKSNPFKPENSANNVFALSKFFISGTMQPLRDPLFRRSDVKYLVSTEQTAEIDLSLRNSMSSCSFLQLLPLVG